MSLTTSEMTPADFAAVTGNNNDGFGGGDGWLVLFILLLACGGWGNGFGGGFGNNGGAGNLYPWMNQSDQINDGFRDQMMNGNITSIRDSIASLSTQLCNCCGDMQMALCNGFAGVEQGANARQIANMNQMFGMQTAIGQGFNSLTAQGSDIKYAIATENCADRQALNDGVRDIIAAQNAGTQAILDRICADKIDAKNDEISQLRQELLYARGQASQDVQTAAIRTGQATTANQLVNELRSCPIPSMPVYGQTPIFTCNSGCNNGGCGCGA